MLLELPETAPGYYAANLTESGTLPARPRPSMVLRYEACGGLFNQVRRRAVLIVSCKPYVQRVLDRVPTLQPWPDT